MCGVANTEELQTPELNRVDSEKKKLYRMGHEKVARVRSVTQIQKLTQQPNVERI